MAIVEVRGHGDDGLSYGLTDLCLGVLFELLEDHACDFWRSVVVAPHRDVGVAVGVFRQLEGHLFDILLYCGIRVTPTDETLHRVDRVFWIGYSLTLGGGAYVSLVGSGVHCDHRWRRPSPFGALDNARLTRFNDRHARIGSAKVYAKYLGQLKVLLGFVGRLLLCARVRLRLGFRWPGHADLGCAQQALT